MGAAERAALRRRLAVGEQAAALSRRATPLLRQPQPVATQRQQTCPALARQAEGQQQTSTLIRCLLNMAAGLAAAYLQQAVRVVLAVHLGSAAVAVQVGQGSQLAMRPRRAGQVAEQASGPFPVALAARVERHPAHPAPLARLVRSCSADLEAAAGAQMAHQHAALVERVALPAAAVVAVRPV